MTTDITDPDGQTTVDVHKEAVSGLFGRDFIYMAFWAIQLILVACVTPFLTRLIPQAELGLVAAATAVMQLLNPVFGLGLQTAVPREHSGEHGSQGARQLVTLGAVLALLAGLITYAAGAMVGPADRPRILPNCGALRGDLGGPHCGYQSGPQSHPYRNQLRWFIAISFAQSIFAQALALALVIFVSATASEYLLGQVLGQLVAAGIALAVAKPARSGSCASADVRERAAVLDGARARHGRVVRHCRGRSARDPRGPGSANDSHYAVASNIGSFTLGLLGFLDFVWLPRLFAIKDDGGAPPRSRRKPRRPVHPGRRVRNRDRIRVARDPLDLVPAEL